MEQNTVFQAQSRENVRKSAFDLSHTKALSAKMGYLIPTLIQEVIPSDEFNIQQENFVRLAPMLAPVMHMINITTHFFFVPNRILWSEWEDFITGGKEGTSDPAMPAGSLDNIMTNTTWAPLGDYMGLPDVETAGSSTLQVSQLPFRAYQKIYNDYYRDQTLNDEVDLTSGSIYVLRKSSWEKDYFTSSLPFLQRGAEIGVPIEVEYRETAQLFNPGNGAPEQTDGNLEAGNFGRIRVNDGTPTSFLELRNIENTLDFTINELRTSSALQRFLEKQATGGYRYTETLRNHFNVRSSDQRLDRAEYIGGGKNPVVITEVLSNTQTLDSTDSVTTPVGEMAGHGISQGQTISANYEVEEHGYIIGITRVLPNSQYFQGIPKHFLYDDKFDYAWPELANLGEQPVLNAELYYDADDDTYNNATFGYQQRYAQYKFSQSTVHGDFRDTLKYWHMAREFQNQPALNGEFVQATPTDRIFAVQNEDHIWIQILNKVKALRPLPYFSNPQLR